MNVSKFIVVGENIHCTRVLKRGGAHVVRDETTNEEAIAYTAGGKRRNLPIPAVFRESEEWTRGRVRHCAVAVWQGLHGDAGARAAAEDYLRALAGQQQAAGAGFLDVNVDEFSADIEKRAAAMRWTAQVLRKSVTVPLSIDSSNTAILRVGLEECGGTTGSPMINSVSLERKEAISLAAEFGAEVVASAAGEHDLPATVEQRISNLDRLMALLKDAGLKEPAIHVDPLVFPVATDPANGRLFLESVRAIRKAYGNAVHITGGLSNVSFGMPKRALLNKVFAYLCVEAGADGGIVDPLQINLSVLRTMETDSEAFRLARAALTGEDEFGMNFIMACREGVV